jgi:predicted RNase H-like HicB family nuclease
MQSAEQPPPSAPDTAGPPRVRKVSEPESVPVYNCHVLVSPRDEQGIVVARVATLANVTGQGKTEREALQNLVGAFKSAMARHHQSGAPIPWLDPPVEPQPDQQQRWIAVHL